MFDYAIKNNTSKKTNLIYIVKNYSNKLYVIVKKVINLIEKLW